MAKKNKDKKVEVESKWTVGMVGVDDKLHRADIRYAVVGGEIVVLEMNVYPDPIDSSVLN